jgi:hypothetical protein
MSAVAMCVCGAVGQRLAGGSLDMRDRSESGSTLPPGRRFAKLDVLCIF